MSIQLTVPPKRELKPRIVVFGVGGAGCNAVNNMIAAGLEGCRFCRRQYRRAVTQQFIGRSADSNRVQTD